MILDQAGRAVAGVGLAKVAVLRDDSQSFAIKRAAREAPSPWRVMSHFRGPRRDRVKNREAGDQAWRTRDGERQCERQKRQIWNQKARSYVGEIGGEKNRGGRQQPSPRAEAQREQTHGRQEKCRSNHALRLASAHAYFERQARKIGDLIALEAARHLLNRDHVKVWIPE